MPKKKTRQKHQSSPVVGELTDTSDDESQAQLNKCCPHITKAVSVAGLKKTFKTAFNFGECQVCQKAPKDNAAQEDCNEELLVGDSAWLCLQCGHQGCGRNASQHSLQHYRTPHSDCHAIVVDGTSWTIWCYECDDEVSVEASRRLTECIDFVRKHVGLTSRSNTPATPIGTGRRACLEENDNEKSAAVKSGDPRKSKEPTKNNGKKPPNGLVNNSLKVKGLSNLGNTCFFNAVMQNLTQSKRFINALESHCGENAIWTLPAECVTDFEPVKEVVLPECGTLTHSVLQFFNNMNFQGKNGIANPNQLFGQVCRKAPQFRGFQQQDSHELLRHLLDGVRTEEIRRQKLGILKVYGLSEKVNTNEVDEELRRKIKAYSRQASHTIVDKVFGGQLVSTVLCEECHQPSQVIEPFMDLSLPVGEEKPTRPGSQRRSVSSDEPSTEPFGRRQQGMKDDKPACKYQEKKLKKQAKKEAKRQVKTAKVTASKLNLSGGEKQKPEEMMAKDALENDLTDADVEDNDETETSSRHSPNLYQFQKETNNSAQETEFNIHSNISPKDDVELQAECIETPEDGGQGMQNETENMEYCTEVIEPRILVKELHSIAEGPMQNGCNLHNQEDHILTTESMGITEKLNVQQECFCGDQKNFNSECALVNSETNDFNKGPFALMEHTRQQDLPSDLPQSAAEEDLHTKTVDDLCAKVTRLSIRRKSESKDSLLETPEERTCYGAGDDANSPLDENSSDSGIGNGQIKKEEKQHKRVECKTLDSDCLAKSLTTMAPRYHPSSHECSVMSCLHQFTMLELLTGNNKFGCDNCTRKRASKGSDSSSAKEEKAYSNASKQLLILCPPSILTLHLKRFQQVGRSLKKMNMFVEFPLILDLAPFCSSLALGLTHVEEGQQKILYSLYGVVEHSGRLTGGHYTAYVKVCKEQSKVAKSYLNEVPIGRQEIDRLKADMINKYDISSSVASDEGNKGVWYHVSDSHVSTVVESTVLRCQAYLLFYERIM